MFGSERVEVDLGLRALIALGFAALSAERPAAEPHLSLCSS